MSKARKLLEQILHMSEDNTEHVLKGAQVYELPPDKDSEEENSKLRNSELWVPRAKSKLKVRFS